MGDIVPPAVDIPIIEVPNPCTVVSDPESQALCTDVWCDIKDDPISYNSVYSTSYLATQYLPFLFLGVTNVVEDDLTWYLFKTSFLQALPYLLTFLVLFVVLGYTGVLNWDITILLMVMLTALTLICIILIAQSAVDIVYQVRNDVMAQVNANLDLYGDDIAIILGLSAFAPDFFQDYICPIDNAEEINANAQAVVANIPANTAEVAAAKARLIEKIKSKYLQEIKLP